MQLGLFSCDLYFRAVCRWNIIFQDLKKEFVSFYSFYQAHFNSDHTGFRYTIRTMSKYKDMPVSSRSRFKLTRAFIARVSSYFFFLYPYGVIFPDTYSRHGNSLECNLCSILHARSLSRLSYKAITISTSSIMQFQNRKFTLRLFHWTSPFKPEVPRRSFEEDTSYCMEFKDWNSSLNIAYPGGLK